MKTSIEKSKGTVRFALKESQIKLKNDKNKKSPIYMYFSYGEDRFKYSTGYKCSFNNWDFTKQTVKNKIAILNRDEINAHLSDLKKFIIKTYRELSKTHQRVSKELLKHKLDVFTKKVPSINEYVKNLTFFESINQYIEAKEGDIGIVTIRSYKQTLKLLEKFDKKEKVKLSFENINMTFYRRFKAYLENEQYALNTIGKHMKSLKTFMNYAVSEGHTNNQKYKSKDFKETKEIVAEIYLTEEEIYEMLKFDLMRYPKLQHARDVFLMGCYTGQRISDYNNLKTEDIISIDNIEYFKIKQKKNSRYGREVMCPITKEMREIMNSRYSGQPPLRINESDLNENIKQVGQMLNFNELIKVEFTKGGKKVTKLIPKYNMIKSHTARRSFCTNKYKAGMSVFDIMLFSGHSTEKEFYKYIRIRNQERASHIVKSGYFNI